MYFSQHCFRYIHDNLKCVFFLTVSLKYFLNSLQRVFCGGRTGLFSGILFSFQRVRDFLSYLFYWILVKIIIIRAYTQDDAIILNSLRLFHETISDPF